jgi:FKBP-type peptidyl-prolyl cis-trans isomerase FkpA
MVLSGLHAKAMVDESATVDGDVSYAFGMIIGSDLKKAGLTFNYGAFTLGLQDMVEGKSTKFTEDEALVMVQTAFRAVMAQRAEESRAKEAQFFEENGKKPGVVTTESGLQYELLTEGTGPAPALTDTVRVNYEGALPDGTVFDSSYDRGEPEELPLAFVIPGWAEGLQLMKVGSAYRFYIPSRLAYGEEGVGNVIPPFSPLVFKVELLEIVPPKEDADT